MRLQPETGREFVRELSQEIGSQEAGRTKAYAHLFSPPFSSLLSQHPQAMGCYRHAQDRASHLI